MNKRCIYFLISTPESGSHGLEQALQARLAHRYLDLPRPGAFDRLLGRIREVPDEAQVIGGRWLHVGLKAALPGAEIRECILVQDPTDLFLGRYSNCWTRSEDGWQARPPAFEAWYDTQTRNPVTRHLASKYLAPSHPTLARRSSAEAFEMIEAFLTGAYFVGSVRWADRLMATLAEDLGLELDTEPLLPPTPPRRLIAADLDLQLRRRIEHENALDQALVDRWGERGINGGPKQIPHQLPTEDRGGGHSWLMRSRRRLGWR